MKKYELIVIGGGSAGHAAARTAVGLGLRCALIEAPGTLGGLCILRGCMPSKILLETASRMRVIREAERFGIRAGKPDADLAEIHSRFAELMKDFQEYREKEMQTCGYDLVRGTAAFEETHRIRVTDDVGTADYEADAFIIATGSRIRIPDIPGLSDTPYWTSDDLLELRGIPEEIVIMGGGSIGMEAAHLLEGLGSKVTVLIRKEHLSFGQDPEIAAALEAESRERGISFITGTELERVSFSDGKFLLNRKGGSPAIRTGALLVATGREPNTKDVGLDRIGLAMDGGLILMDDRCCTSLPHIFAAGDCASPIPVVHLAVIQGEVAAKNAERVIRDGHSELSAEWPRESAMTGTFTDPQSVEIGVSVRKSTANGIPVITGEVAYNDQGKGMIAGSRHGFVKIIAEKESRRIIGACGVGPEVLETSHVVQMAIELGMTLEEYVRIPHYHPTLAEAWASAAQDAIDSHPIKE